MLLQINFSLSCALLFLWKNIESFVLVVFKLFVLIPFVFTGPLCLFTPVSFLAMSFNIVDVFCCYRYLYFFTDTLCLPIPYVYRYLLFLQIS